MSQQSLPFIPKHSDQASQGSQERHPPSAGTTSSDVGAPPPERFYRAKGKANARQESSPDRVPPQLSQHLVTLEETKEGALHTLALCRNVIITLELTRLRKSRTGYSYWLTFWGRIYERTLARTLCSRVATALTKIDALFRAVSHELQQLTSRMEHAVSVASSEKEILHLLERMEEEVSARRRRRRKKAQSIMEKMRANIEAIPVRVSDELFDDLKRGVFALDVFCDYHPGDPEAEAIEMRCPDINQRFMSSTPISPYNYRRLQESLASGAYMDPGYYPSNTYFNYAEDLMYEDGDHPVWRAVESRSTFDW
ncbi:uncharacterized protein ACLA_058840 [Aspergillus clavatus NRRL 1]|uniref:Uncharacterized protein n=1 Tax=Aspergillus clavatus (strain ATCC 1007 / CBS 513.65 / DSM 816 / NCTC 3887 / NRRL 1 / QM 1276 / 107) TaxID=344612 RepID=A1C482_ASPCL|nr:uncharacterized protein ACLA_058840 [Aspergillus clavatus NRRL 1]EAW15222.1 conserved hypothetical protein [Aspergillus clavatus NRRL 1]